jgi:leucine dehydrogenase
MTYKCAISEIGFGGGKSVIIGDPSVDKTPAILHAMADFVEDLGGRYIISFDMGTNLDDVRIMGQRTTHVGGIAEGAGNASDSTAEGVFICIRAALKHRLGSNSLKGRTVAIQGVGNVGSRLAKRLAEAGARIVVADIDAEAAQAVASQTGARIVNNAAIHRVEADIFSPCARGGILNAQTIPELKAAIVAGGANNQLASAADAKLLLQRDIVYCPDYLVNAGGIVDLYYQRPEINRSGLPAHLKRLGETLGEILARAKSEGATSAAICDAMAEERFRDAKVSNP